MFLASPTTLGSAVITPSVSVQICASSADSAAARSVAVKSLPLRPTVVTSPASFLPMNPVTIGTSSFGSAENAFVTRSSKPGNGRARPNAESVMNPRSHTSYARAVSP